MLTGAADRSEKTPVLLGKMGLISNRLACLKKRPISKSNEHAGFCLYTDLYGVALNECPVPSSSYLNLLFSYATSDFNYIAYALPYKCDKAIQIFLINLVPLFMNCLLHLLYIKPLATVGELFLY